MLLLIGVPNMYCLLLNNQPHLLLPFFKYKNSKAVENSKKNIL
jgi:hypothetical protein